MACLSILTISGCRNGVPEKSITDYIDKITCSNIEDNALRVAVDINFKQDCNYSISYWRETEPEKVTTTKNRPSENLSGNTVLLFLHPDSQYKFKVNIENGPESDVYDFETFSIPAEIPTYQAGVGEDYKIPGYIFQTQIAKAGYITIADTDGNIVWYQYIDQAARQFFLNLEEGRIWLLTGYKINSTGPFQRLVKRILCIDLYGNVLHSWSVKDEEIDIPYPHHEIREMKDGSIAVVCNAVRKFDLTPIGGEAETEVYGDGYTFFNTKGEVLKTWDFFNEVDVLHCDYLNPVRDCNDLAHANSFNYDSEGNYYMTFNNCSQLWKIDATTGKVLYRVGPGGNVTLDESGYAEGLHAAVPLEPDRVLCLDNGRERGYSRAIIYKVNPSAMSAEAELSVPIDTDFSSKDRSNVELIQNGTVLMFGMTNSHFVVFTDLNGKVLKSVQRTGMSYRTGYIETLPLI